MFKYLSIFQLPLLKFFTPSVPSLQFYKCSFESKGISAFTKYLTPLGPILLSSN